MNKEKWLYRLLKYLGLTTEYKVSKKDMCKQAKHMCHKNCEQCAWNDNNNI